MGLFIHLIIHPNKNKINLVFTFFINFEHNSFNSALHCYWGSFSLQKKRPSNLEGHNLIDVFIPDD